MKLLNHWNNPKQMCPINFDQLIDEHLGEFPNIDITGTGALTCDVIDEDLETTLGLLHLMGMSTWTY